MWKKSIKHIEINIDDNDDDDDEQVEIKIIFDRSRSPGEYEQYYQREKKN